MLFKHARDRRAAAAARQAGVCTVGPGGFVLELAALDATIRWTEADVLALPTKEYYQERRLKSLGLDTEWDDQEGNAWSGSRGAAW